MTKFLLLSVFSAGVVLAQTKTGDTGNGKRLFERSGCYQCHGRCWPRWPGGARLVQPSCPRVAFIAYVRNPSSGGMPPFRVKVMSDQDLADIYAYIKTFPDPQAAQDIPLLNQ